LYRISSGDSTIRIEKFKAADWYIKDPIDLTKATEEDILKLEKFSIAFSGFDDSGECIACGGFIFWTPDEAEVWFKLSKRVLKHPTVIVRAIMEAFRIELRLFDGYTFCWVDEKWSVAQRFAKWGGFVKTKEERILDNRLYFLWELDRGSILNDSGACNVRRRGHPTRKPRRTTDGAASSNTRV
jgi:hypothetical protein